MKSAGGYFKPSNRSPQSPQRHIFHHLWLSIKLTFPSFLLQAFKETPKMGAVDSRQSSIAHAETPSCGHPQAALPQSVTSAWFPRWGRRYGEEASPRSSSPARTAAGRCGRGAEEMLNPSVIFTLAFSLSKRVLVSNNIVFKGELKRPKH